MEIYKVTLPRFIKKFYESKKSFDQHWPINLRHSKYGDVVGLGKFLLSISFLIASVPAKLILGFLLSFCCNPGILYKYILNLILYFLDLQIVIGHSLGSLLG